MAIDGVDASGKTTLADALARDCPRVLRASIDGFHRPRALRFPPGKSSAEACYHDTFDVDAFKAVLLDPFVRGEPVRTAVFDVLADVPVDAAPVTPEEDALLVVDGVFLLRPELADCWDLTVHLIISDDEVLRRARRRDDGDPHEIERRYRERYLPAQDLYRTECSPAECADVVLDNTHPLI